MGKAKKAAQGSSNTAGSDAVSLDNTTAPKASKKAKAVTEQPAPPNTAITGAADKATAATKGTKKRAKDEINEIFGKPKKQQAEQAADGQQADALDPELQEVANQVEAARKQAQAKKPKIEGSKDDIFGEQTGKSRKRTEEGYAIYGEDELGLSKKGGDTPLCPFDCDCCY